MPLLVIRVPEAGGQIQGRMPDRNTPMFAETELAAVLVGGDPPVLRVTVAATGDLFWEGRVLGLLRRGNPSVDKAAVAEVMERIAARLRVEVA